MTTAPANFAPSTETALRTHPPRRAARELLANLVARELKARYKGSLLGFLWALLTPLLMAAIYVFFLRLLADRGVSVESVIIGVFAWTFTAQSVQSGLTAITGNANLVKKVAFPRVLLPTAATAANAVNYLFSLFVQFAVVGVLLVRRGAFFSAWTPVLPVIFATHAALNLALALLLSAANVYFRDTQHLVGVGLSAWFFVSPAMYDLGLVEPWGTARPWLLRLYLLNPLAPVFTGYRAALLPDLSFPWNGWAIGGLLISWAMLAVALAIFRRAQRNFADFL